MKLRLRSVESRETLKLDLPDDCSLRLLKQTLAPSATVRLSLNRKDELCSSAADDADSLTALGIASGDLIYYSICPDAFSSSPVIPTPSSGGEDGGGSSGGMDSMEIDTPVKSEEDAAVRGEMEEGEEVKGSSSGDADAEFYDVYKYSVPYFLRRIFREELGKDDVEHRLLVIAIHAVMLESGFVGYDPVTRSWAVAGMHLPDELPSPALSVSLPYTLPELVADGSGDVESVVLKFVSMGHFLTVYGRLAKGSSGLHRICLDEYRFAQTMDLMWANCDKDVVEYNRHGGGSSYPDSEVFEFWKLVKDGLVLPLLIDLCERANLPLPSCLMCLPTELKLQIVELLDTNDLVRMASVNSEFRYLSSHNDVWKKKFLNDFGTVGETQGVSNWKLLYISYKKRRDKVRIRASFPERPNRWFRPYQGIWREPVPFGVPRIIGGDHDWLPGLGPPSFGRHGGFPRFPIRRNNVGTNCNLGRLNG